MKEDPTLRVFNSGLRYPVNADVTRKVTKNMPLQTAYFASKRQRDVDVSLEPYLESDFTNSIDN